MTAHKPKKKCACGRDAHARGMCHICYNKDWKRRTGRAHNTGDGMKMMRLSQARIDANIERIVAAAMASGTWGMDASTDRWYKEPGPIRCIRVG